MADEDASEMPHNHDDNKLVRKGGNTDDASHNHQHFKMYKPAKVLTQFVFTHRKRRKRTLLGDVMKDIPPGLMAIGRLDESSEGLLLLTTDGKVSERIRQKSVEKEYWAQLDGTVTADALDRLQKGVDIRLPGHEEPYRTLPCKACILDTIQVKIDKPKACNVQKGSDNSQQKKKKFKGTCNVCGLVGHKTQDCDKNIYDAPVEKGDTTIALPPGIPVHTWAIRSETRHGPTSWVSITVTEGKNRQLRRMTAAVGFPTLRLVRVRIGSIALDDMAVGETREVDSADLSDFV